MKNRMRWRAALLCIAAFCLAGAWAPSNRELDGQAAPNPISAMAVAGMRSFAAGDGQSRAFLTILCKFADVPHEPEPPAFFERMLGSTYPGLDHYWREVSYGRMNLAGSRVTGWVVLPAAEAAYRMADNDPDYFKLAQDCLGSSRVNPEAQAFYGLNLVFNAPLAEPHGGRICLTLATQRRCYGVTWMWPPRLHDQAAWVHEVGHALGLTHTHSDQGRVYGDVWSIMGEDGACATAPGFGRIAQHLIAYDKDWLGWIPTDARLLVSTPGTSEVVLAPLARLARPPNTFLLAEVPISGSKDHFYTIEARSRAGYDASLPFDAVVIHEVDHRAKSGGREGPITVRWQGTPHDGPIGSAFTDARHGIRVMVERQTEEGFAVSVHLTRVDDSPVEVIPTFPASLTSAIERARKSRPLAPDLRSTRSGNLLDGSVLELPRAREAVAVDGAGHEYALRVQRHGLTESVVFGQLAPDNRLSHTVVLDRRAELGGVGAPVLAIDRTGRVYAAWSRLEAGVWHIQFSLRSSESGAWTEPEEVGGQGAGDAWSPALEIDPGGRVLVLWRSRSPCADGRSISALNLSVRNENGRWNPVEKVDANLTTGAVSGLRLISDEDGDLYAEWQDKSAENVVIYAAYRPACGQWTAKWQVPTGGGRQIRALS